MVFGQTSDKAGTYLPQSAVGGRRPIQTITVPDHPVRQTRPRPQSVSVQNQPPLSANHGAVPPAGDRPYRCRRKRAILSFVQRLVEEVCVDITTLRRSISDNQTPDFAEKSDVSKCYTGCGRFPTVPPLGGLLDGNRYTNQIAPFGPGTVILTHFGVSQ